MPAGVFNVNEDSEDDDAYTGEQKEIAREMDELRVAEHWVNPEGWDAIGEGRAASTSAGVEIDLRLDWGPVKQALAQGAGGAADVVEHIDEDVVLQDYSLDDLDPTQRVFADRVLAWV